MVFPHLVSAFSVTMLLLVTIRFSFCWPCIEYGIMQSSSGVLCTPSLSRLSVRFCFSLPAVYREICSQSFHLQRKHTHTYINMNFDVNIKMKTEKKKIQKRWKNETWSNQSRKKIERSSEIKLQWLQIERERDESGRYSIKLKPDLCWHRHTYKVCT